MAAREYHPQQLRQLNIRPKRPTHPPLTGILSQHPPSSPTHRYEVCFLNASPLNFSSSVSCSMSGRLLNVSLQQPMAASSEPAPDSESPPSAPREARRPLKPPVAGLVRSFAWGSMLVGPRCLAPRWTPFSPRLESGHRCRCGTGELKRLAGIKNVFFSGLTVVISDNDRFYIL